MPNILCFLVFLSVGVDNNDDEFGDGEVVQQDPEKDDYSTIRLIKHKGQKIRQTSNDFFQASANLGATSTSTDHNVF